jgi:hypothetical protein
MALTLLGQLKLFTIAPGNMCPVVPETAALLTARYTESKKTGGDKPAFTFPRHHHKTISGSVYLF